MIARHIVHGIVTLVGGNRDQAMILITATQTRAWRFAWVDWCDLAGEGITEKHRELSARDERVSAGNPPNML